MSAPPEGAAFHLREIPDLRMTEDEARRILRAPLEAIGREDDRLAPAEEVGRIAHDLGLLARAWWREATIFTGRAPFATPRGASASDRAAYCGGVAAAADKLLVAMGAPPATGFPVMCQQGGGRVFVQVSPQTRVADAIGNLVGPVGVANRADLEGRNDKTAAAWDADRAALERQAEKVELHFAPAMATASAPGAFPDARRVDDQVLAAAVAGVALLRDWAAISAQAWTLRAEQAGRRKGGRQKAEVRDWALRCLAERFDQAFGLEPGGWKTPIRGVQSASYECFAAFVVAFCDWFARRCSAEQRAEMGPDDPGRVTVEMVRKVAPTVAKRREKAGGDETASRAGWKSILVQ